MLKIENGAVVSPVFEDNCIPICFSANNSYFPQTAVMICSIIDNASDDKNYDVIILSTDIDEENEKIAIGFSKGRKNVSIRIVDISSMLENVSFFTDSVYTPTTYSKEAYFRLFIPFAMPDYEKVIYFDGDMVAVSDVSPLMDIDMSEYVAAATRDYCGIAACYDNTSGRLEYRQKIGIKDMDRYFISSMVLVNIRKLNELYTLDDLKKIISSRNWRQHDQDIFNVLCQDQLLIVDAKWSFFEEYDYSMRFLPEYLKEELIESSKCPIVVHYAGSNKAWQDERSELTDYFWKYAAKTPYFGEFFNKIGVDSVSYRYHTFKKFAEGEIDYCNAPVGFMLLSAPYFLGYVNNLRVAIERVQIKSGKVSIGGYYEYVDAFGELELVARLDKKDVEVECGAEPRKYGLSSKVKPIREFSVVFKIEKWRENILEFAFSYGDGKRIIPYYVSVEQFAPINEYGYSFYSCDDVIMTKRDGRLIVFEPYSKKKILFLNKKICEHLNSHRNKYFRKMAVVRNLYYATKRRMKEKNVCLVSCGRDRVDESSIALVEYLSKLGGVTPYLVVARDSELSGLVKKRVNVLYAQSRKHKFMFLHAKTLIVSDYYMPFVLPLYSRSNEIRDMIANKRIIYWHKHGNDVLTMDRAWHNVDRFLVSDREVYRELCERDNGYCADDVTLYESESGAELYSLIADSITGRNDK